MSIEAHTSPAEGEDFTALNAQLIELQKEQHAGQWDYKGDPSDEAAKQAHEEYIRNRVRLGIELTARLRRSNTGPAKATGKRGAAGKKGKSAEELQAIEDELLS